MFDQWSPVHSGIAGAIIAALVMSLASSQKPRLEGGSQILEYAGILKLFMVVGIVAMPALAAVSVTEALIPFINGRSRSVLDLFTPAILIPLGFAGLYSGYRALFETVSFDESGFRQKRTLPRWERYVAWSDVERYGYMTFLQTYWIKPRSGPKFIYFDGMRGLNEFNERLINGSRNEPRIT